MLPLKSKPQVLTAELVSNRASCFPKQNKKKPHKRAHTHTNTQIIVRGLLCNALLLLIICIGCVDINEHIPIHGPSPSSTASKGNFIKLSFKSRTYFMHKEQALYQWWIHYHYDNRPVNMLDYLQRYTVFPVYLSHNPTVCNCCQQILSVHAWCPLWQLLRTTKTPDKPIVYQKASSISSNEYQLCLERTNK